MALKRLYFDLETSPAVGYFWRPGWKINISYHNIVQEPQIICVCYKWAGEDKTYSLDWGKGQSDKGLLKKFIKIANKADQLVGHNGDRFDLKWIKTRCLFHDIPTFPKYQTIDTLKQARANFNFNSNRLDYIAKFLGFEGKKDTGGFQLWVDCMNGDEKALKKMIDYCKGDVVILEKVFDRINNYVPHRAHARVNEDAEKWQCPECLSTNVILNRSTTTAMGTIRRQMNCKKCQKYYTISNKAYMDLLTWRVLNR